MTFRLLSAAGLLAGLMFAATAAESKDAAAAKEALAEVGDLVGTWKAAATGTVDGRKLNWTETHTWGWKFKDGNAWMAVEAKDGRFFTAGDLTYNPKTRTYRLTAKDKDGKERAYEGKLTGGKLVLTHRDAATGDDHKLSIGTLASGARMTIKQEVQEKGKGPYADQFVMNGSKEGEALAGGGGKKNICCVTGGLGTMAVSFSGKTYYVCCSGCRDEFNADPKKYVDEFEKKKRK